MALTQATQLVKGDAAFDHIDFRGTKLFQTTLDIGSLVAASNKQAALNEMIEFFVLPKNYQVKSIAFSSTAATSGQFAVRILAGDVGKDEVARYAAGKFTDLRAAAIIANGVSRTDCFGVQRPTAEKEKTAAVALFCGAASSAAETAKVTVYVEYFLENSED